MEDVPQIYETLHDILGDEATLAFPTFTLRKRLKPFDYKASCDKTNGVLSLYAQKYKDGIRSKSLLHSYFLHSRGTKLALPGDKVDRSFGEGSIFDYFLENDFQVLLLGCNFQQGATFVHHVERLANVYYRQDITLDKEFIDNNGIVQKIPYRYYSRKSDFVKTNLGQFESDFCDTDFVRKVLFEKTESYSFSMKIASTFLINKLSQNPNYLLES